MEERQYECGYKYCLHRGEKVSAAESVMVNGKHYHWDCAEISQEIKVCVDAYMSCVEDKSLYSVAYRIMNILVLQNEIPPQFILERISVSKDYYKNKSPMVLYGLRKLFWEKM